MSYCAFVSECMSVYMYVSIYTHKYIYICLRTLIVLNFNHAQKLQNGWSFKCLLECYRNKSRGGMAGCSMDQVLKDAVFHFVLLIPWNIISIPNKLNVPPQKFKNMPVPGLKWRAEKYASGSIPLGLISTFCTEATSLQWAVPCCHTQYIRTDCKCISLLLALHLNLTVWTA